MRVPFDEKPLGKEDCRGLHEHSIKVAREKVICGNGSKTFDTVLRCHGGQKKESGLKFSHSSLDALSLLLDSIFLCLAIAT